ncbi:MAG: maleylpyruvate isomerase family mycothiol-dependent enzyme [Rhodococcus sp.]|uniref:maleylpyruvate isomerase family mycothiol-dependent enzyme n=1 Tax=Rhodococcus TaxID=1827 RepID=UPI0016ADEE53|nr:MULTISPECIES: maleylpyruvate isomerase family mycothiol-dependent enzyme [Rhodococcus]NLV79582.1 maleylpyruvate isomerase family mycothiol-dependent enzyme [Rhodococcus sp. (in: high G+C Gram-positive bacteria)]
MNTTALRHAEAERPLTEVIDAVTPEGWDRPSPCEDWTTRDVLAHIIDTQRDFLLGRGLDPGDRPDLADPAAAWHRHTAEVARILADDTVPATEYDGYFGSTTIGATFEQFYVWDLLVHRWDLATGAGLGADLTDAELDRIDAGADSFGDSLHLEGVCKPAVDAESSDRQARVLARLGRRAAR